MPKIDAMAPTQDASWRLTHLGRLLGQALRRFDERVLVLMASHVDVPLALSNLAARHQVRPAHLHIPPPPVGEPPAGFGGAGRAGHHRYIHFDIGPMVAQLVRQTD